VIEKLSIALQALCGLGLFLLGMIIMAEGLREMAGDAIRTALMRFTSSPTSGAVTCAVSTAILQSSSAGIAATMTALYAGAISFEQGLALVIGMDVGTTITAIIASIGGTIGAKRTGLSHFIYNLLYGYRCIVADYAVYHGRMMMPCCKHPLLR
jgi:phosphate:Na+ symporter